MKFKLQLMPDGERWGVYVRPDDSIDPKKNFTIVGSGKVRLVMPKGYQLSDLQNVNGVWVSNGFVENEYEFPNQRIHGFSYVTETTPIPFSKGEETLLFTFKGTTVCPSCIRLINNVEAIGFASSDYFLENEITVFDMLTGNVYEYGGNYAIGSWSCRDNDGDGILNAFEDTNGNGLYDPGLDASDLNEGITINSINGIKFTLKLLPHTDRLWSVYAKPEDAINLHLGQTSLKSATVSLVLPLNFQLSQFQHFIGNWSVSSPVNGAAWGIPNAQIVTANLNSETVSIALEKGLETRLFEFKGTYCPDFIRLLDNNEIDLSGSPSYDPSNKFQLFDLISNEIYTYNGNYAPAAWDCHDNDGDGITNAMEDTNGNGIWDSGTDASDLNQAETPAVVKLKLKFLPDSSGWAVMAKTFDGFEQNGHSFIESGRITVVMPSDFEFGGFNDFGFHWTPTTIMADMPNDPNWKYTTFEYTGPTSTFYVYPVAESKLFKFAKLGDCPDSLYILEDAAATGPLPNELIGYTSFGWANRDLNYGGVYTHKSWRCNQDNANHRPPIIIYPTEDDFKGPNPGSTNRDADPNEESNPSDLAKWFSVFPNPSYDHVNISVNEALATDNSTLSVYDLQGHKQLDSQLQSSSPIIDLSSLPAGIYFVLLSQNGLPLQRTKLIKH